MTKGQTQIGIVTAFSGVAVFLIGWLSYTSVKTITNSEQMAAIIQWQKSTDEKLLQSQEQTEKKFDKLNEGMAELSKQGAVTNEIVKLLGERQQINSAAVEARVIREVKRDELSSTTSSNLSSTTI